MASFTGKVLAIKSNADHSTTVMLRKEDGSTETFRHPTDMTDEQFDEFKRAQNNGLSVEVIYNQENHKIESLSVYTEATAVDDDLVISHKNPKKRG